MEGDYSAHLAKSRSASRDMVMLVRFCCRTKMFLHIFLMPDSLILLKYWAPLMRMQEMRWPRPGNGKEKNQHTTLYKIQKAAGGQTRACGR